MSYHNYSDNEIEYLVHNSKAMTRMQLTDSFNKEFGTNISVKSITNKCNSLKSFGKEERHCVGDIVKRADGYLLIKVCNDKSIPKHKRWVLLHRYVWEQEHGNIPSDKVVIFKDGNVENCDITNLMLVDKGVSSIMARCGLYSSDSSITELAVNVSNLIYTINKKKARNSYGK